MSSEEIPDGVWQFISEKIDTVPQLEALLLLWEEPRRVWSAQELAARIYVETDAAESVLQSLQRRQLVAATSQQPARYHYDEGWDPSGSVMDEVARAYRRQLVRLAKFIHAGGSTAVREFARAFDLKSDR